MASVLWVVTPQTSSAVFANHTIAGKTTPKVYSDRDKPLHVSLLERGVHDPCNLVYVCKVNKLKQVRQ